MTIGIAPLRWKSAQSATTAAITAVLLLPLAAAAADGGGESLVAATAPLQTEFAYEAIVTIDPSVEVGPSAHGVRRYIPITGGTFQGPKIKGVVLPGGADWQLQRADGVTEVNALYSMKCDDGSVIVVHNTGVISADGKYLRTTPSFDAPKGRHAWLNQSVFVGSIAGAPQPGAVLIRVFRVL